MALCGLCFRPLNVAGDALSVDCGGACWGCLREIEEQLPDERPRASAGEYRFNLRRGQPRDLVLLAATDRLRDLRRLDQHRLPLDRQIAELRAFLIEQDAPIKP